LPLFAPSRSIPPLSRRQAQIILGFQQFRKTRSVGR